MAVVLAWSRAHCQQSKWQSYADSKMDHQLCFNLVPLFAAWMKCSVTLNISYPTQTALLWRN